MGDLNKRRSRVMGMNPSEIAGYTDIEVDVPALELYGYGAVLRSMTGGAGVFSYEFARYQQASDEVANKQIEERKSKLEESSL